MSAASLVAALVGSPALDDVDPAHRNGLAAEIVGRAALDSDGRPTRLIRDVLDELKNSEPWWFKPVAHPTEAPFKPRRETLTERLREQVKTERQRPATLPDGNPWKAGQVNLTNQCRIMNADPAMAARLKAEAA